jgi:hypothetical protein
MSGDAHPWSLADTPAADEYDYYGEDGYDDEIAAAGPVSAIVA